MSSSITQRDIIITFSGLAFVFLSSSLYWYFLTGRTAIQYYDSLFVSSVGFMCLGLLIAIANTSRRHYYKHLRNKYKTGSTDDTKYEIERIDRLRYTRIGAAISLSGILGIIVCAALAL